MTYSPLNINVYTAAYAGATAGVGIPTGAFIIDPVSNDYAEQISVAVVFAQAVDTAWGAVGANVYDIEAITDAADNLFARGPGCPIEGVIVTQANWTIVATALVALIRKGDSVATAGGIVFPTIGGTIIPPFTTTQELWVASIWGSDTTGDGSIFNPFQTIAHAQSVIPDATATKLYEIILYPGIYSENVALKAYTKIVGFDPTQSSFNSTYPANLTGNISLGASFAVGLPSLPIAWITNVNIGGTTFELDFVTDGSTNGSVSITNCQFTTSCVVDMGPDNFFELHGCTLFVAYTQTGGSVIWENTVGGNSGNELNVSADIGTGAELQMFNSSWEGDISADQNGNTTPGETVTIEMINSQARNGTCTLTASGSNVPTIDCSYGDLPENVVLAGSAAIKLGRQMRVSLGLHVPSGTVIASFNTTDITIPLSSGVIGAANIEEMSCTITPNGDVWNTQLVANKISWSTYVVQNSTTSEIHFVFQSQSDSPTTVAANLPFLFYAFLPNLIG